MYDDGQLEDDERKIRLAEEMVNKILFSYDVNTVPPNSHVQLDGVFALDAYKYELDVDEQYIQLVWNDDIAYEEIEFQYVTPKDSWDLMGLREAQRLFNEREEMKALGCTEDYGPDSNRWYYPDEWHDDFTPIPKPGKASNERRWISYYKR